MTSNELKDALARRLNRVEATNESGESNGAPATDIDRRRLSAASEEGANAKSAAGPISPNTQEAAQTFRSGWGSTPPIHRSTALPYGPFVPGPPLKSEKVTRKPSAEEINSGLVDQRRKDLSRGPSVNEDGKSRRSSDGLRVVASKLVDPEGGVVKEGYLSKFSSGALTSRWQKRYFILKESALEYFGNQGQVRSNSASVSFPVHRLKSVLPVAGNEKAFELVIGKKNRRQYQLKAGSADSCKEWISAIERVMNGNHHNNGSSAGSVASEDVDESVFGSSINDNSSSVSTGERNGSSLNIISETLWEQPEISGEELDVLFSEWFVFLEDPNTEIKAGRIIDASSRSVSDLWAVLGKLPRGEDVVFEEAKKYILNFFRPGLSDQTMYEYVKRLCGKLLEWLNRRPLNPDEIPVVIEWVSRFDKNLRSLLQSSNVSETEEVIQRVLNALKAVLRKLGVEWEVGVIEDIQRFTPSESIWDFPPAPTDSVVPHGPFLGESGIQGAPKAKIIATSWSYQFFELLSKKCLARTTAGDVSWEVAFPMCCSLLTAHACSVIVAALNSCHRDFKKRVALYASHGTSAGSGRMGIMLKKVQNLITSSSPGNATKVAPEDLRPPTPPPGQLSVPSTATGMQHMVAFGNECTLISVACQHIANIKCFKEASPVFSACLEDMSQTFANTANEVSKMVVKQHFLKKNSKTIRAAFDPKQLAVRVKVPIVETLELAKVFISDLTTLGCHDLFKHLIVGHVMQGVANAYVTSLVTHKPKMTKFTRLAAVVAEDEGLFFTMFKELGRKPTEINTANDQISNIRTVLAEKNLAPPSKGGVPLVQECVELTKAFASTKKAIELVKALLYIKGVNKSDRRDILLSVTACIQRNIESPSPGLLDLSREEDDDDFKDDSGLSSNLSDNRNPEESF